MQDYIKEALSRRIQWTHKNIISIGQGLTEEQLAHQNEQRDGCQAVAGEYFVNVSGQQIETAFERNHEAEAHKPDHGHDVGYRHSCKKDEHHHGNTNNTDNSWIH